jgi:hypothetical protein
MKTITVLTFTLLIIFLSGCGTLRQPASDVLLMGAGGAIGYEASGKKIGGAAIGAGAGYVASRVVNSQMDAALAEAEQRGHDRAMGQAVKQQYWIIQNQQRRDDNAGETDARYVTVSLPETTLPDGTILKPTTATFRTQ